MVQVVTDKLRTKRQSNQLIGLRRVHLKNKCAHELHFLSCVFKYQSWVVIGTTQAIWCPNHGQIVDVHLRVAGNVWRREFLKGNKSRNEYKINNFELPEI